MKFNINNRRYLGCKYSLLKDIEDCIDIKKIKSVADIFSGTGIVGEYFANKGKKVIVNDILYSNYIIYNCFFGIEKFNKENINKYIEKYNSLNEEKLCENYFSINFADTYFSRDNCKKIGWIREDIEKEFKENRINKREKSILITSLIYAIDKIANTVGHYDAYRENRDGLDKKFKMLMPNLKNYKNKIDIFREDANNLVKDIEADLVYIDPPYNSRQYCDMYHLLENLAEWKKPNVYYKARKMDRKHLKSKYSQKEATEAFRVLINNINAKYIIVSYNDTGNKGTERSKAKITDDDMIRILSEKGNLRIEQKEYSIFNTGQSQIEKLQERFFVCEVFNNDNKGKDLKLVKKDLKNNNYIKPPTNYTGSKYKQLDQMFKFLPNNIEEKIVLDMFAGGCSVGINIKGRKIICNDKQKHLIRLYNLFKRENLDTIIKNINNIIDEYELSNVNLNGYEYYNCDSSHGVGKYNKSRYEKIRDRYNSLKESDEKDYLFFILIIYGFNNQIRFNSKGEFNMPVGKRDFNKNIKNNLKETVLKIQNKNIEFISNDFRELDIDCDDNYFIYCDPPYILTNAAYNENGGWTENDEKELLEKLVDLSHKGIAFMLSNVLEHSGKKHNILLEWALKNKFNIIHINKNYKNSSYQKKDKNSESDEVIITNYI